MKKYLEIKIIILLIILLVGCNNKNAEEIDYAEVVNDLELINEQLSDVLVWSDKNKVFGNYPDRIDVKRIYDNYKNTKELIIKDYNNPKFEELVKTNIINLNEYLDDQLGKNARWNEIRISIKSVEEKIAKRLDFHLLSKEERSSKSSIIKKGVLINLEIMYNMIFQLVQSHKYEYELNFGSHEAQIIYDEKISENINEIEIGVFNKSSDTYKIELYCNDKKNDLMNSRGKYRYENQEEIQDSLKITAKTIHLLNGVQIIRTIKYKPN